LVDILKELFGASVLISFWLFGAGDENGKVLGVFSSKDGIDNGFFELFGEFLDSWCTVESTSVPETSGPGVDTGNTIGGGSLSFLMSSKMSSDSSMSCLRLN